MAVTMMAVVSLACLMASTQAWTMKTTAPNGVVASIAPTIDSSNHLNNNVMTRRQSVWRTLALGGGVGWMVNAATSLPAFAAAATTTTLPTGVTYEVVKDGAGPQPDPGELVAIRFAAYYGDRKIDDIYETPEPYYTVSE
jgi:hypothetical protein